MVAATKRGFSIIELMVVLAVVSILAAYAIPRLNESQGRQELHKQARTLVAHVRQAQLVTNALVARKSQRGFFLSSTGRNRR